MCTVIYLREAGLLSKNRDKEVVTDEEIVPTDDYVAVRSNGDSYFSLGVNRHGFAFVSTAVNSPEWTQLVENGEKDRAKDVFAEERRGQHSPTKFISERLADIVSVDDAVSRLESAGLPWMGYNVVMADRDGASVLETFEGDTYRYDLEPRDIVTNHFRRLNHGAKTYDDYPNSFDRYAYAQENLEGLDGLAGLQSVIHPADDDAKAARIWRKAAFSTVSSSVLDITGARLHYTDALNTPYAAHGITA